MKLAVNQFAAFGSDDETLIGPLLLRPEFPLEIFPLFVPCCFGHPASPDKGYKTPSSRYLRAPRAGVTEGPTILPHGPTRPGPGPWGFARGKSDPGRQHSR